MANIPEFHNGPPPGKFFEDNESMLMNPFKIEIFHKPQTMAMMMMIVYYYGNLIPIESMIMQVIFFFSQFTIKIFKTPEIFISVDMFVRQAFDYGINGDGALHLLYVCNYDNNVALNLIRNTIVSIF